MSDLFGIKSASTRSTADLLEPLLEVRFRRMMPPGWDEPWLVALSRDRREHLLLLPNVLPDGRSIDGATEGFDVLLYLVKSWREEKLTRLIATETRFRYVRPSGKVQQFVDGVLSTL